MARRTGLLLFCALALAIALAPRAAAQGAGGANGVCAADLECSYDVPFKAAGGLTLTLDVYRPAEGGDGVPAVVAIHGGGFRVGDKTDMEPEAERLARDGFAIFAPNYRTEECAGNCDEDGDGVTDSVYWGAAGYDDLYEDVADAVLWVRRHGDEYGAETTRVGAFGTSAGAQLALRVNYRGEPGRERADAAVGWSGAYVLDLRLIGLELGEPDSSGFGDGEGKTLTGCTWGSSVDCSRLWAEQSVTHYVDDCGSVSCEPPARMVMGRDEGVIDDDAQGSIMLDVLEDAGVEAALRSYVPGESCLTGVAPVPAQGCGSGPGECSSSHAVFHNCVDPETGLSETETLAAFFGEHLEGRVRSCGGEAATILGTGGRDRIRGTSYGDVILARGGGDQVRGHGGPDLICGGGGMDTLRGGTGRDRLRGGRGRDRKS